VNVVVLGAGVVGVTTAYTLARRGFAVTVIDRRSELAAEASYANGGQLSYDFASPMGSPGVLRHLAGYILGTDEAFRIGLSADPAFMGWGARFLINCLPSHTRRNRETLARIAQRSEGALKDLIVETRVSFEHRAAGKLVLFDSGSDFASAARGARNARKNGRALEALDFDQCLRIEPALNDWRGAPIVGGLYAPHDEVGDARRFSNAIGVIAEEKFGVRFILGKTVDAIVTRNDVACAISIDGAEIDADVVVVCMGVNAPRLLRPLRVAAPIQPIRGYSITAPATPGAPEVAITDLGRKMVYSRIGDKLRIAGFADAGAHSRQFVERRMEKLLECAKQTLPRAAQFTEVSSKWIGVRPSTPNSLPIVGRTNIRGLYLNIGHGMFGWTLSAACARDVAGDIMHDVSGATKRKAA